MSEHVPTLQAEPETSSGRRDAASGKRFWSARKVPAALVSALLLGMAGLLLYDVIAVRAGQPGMGWRRDIASQLAERPLDQVWVQVGAGLAIALGLWLVVLAVTPGLRSLLPMRADATDPDVRAGLDRGAAALVLRDRAMAVPGVEAARVRVGRTKVTVRAVSHFRELADVREELEDAMRAGAADLGLAREPALAVRVERSERVTGGEG
ncbi:DUF6286 domain-containing protein [Streptomyces candidus]|uniref:DUF6286 domain-containing protein n=1 Tax=Streptomyces candidus TaxID=67283 RepID=A0A7X0LTM4_9ACTN|nr:DUF6286 domain-containing protein [Streptomyces candidus]MBB6439186.1 hypothetical protein [Streptomyces candidus]GHH55212.1 hypothetical protein GCM10018773_59300 [Streptomyces candidus]